MPLIPIIIGGGVGFVGGLFISGAAVEVSAAVKWAAILGIALIGAKALKVI